MADDPQPAVEVATAFTASSAVAPFDGKLLSGSPDPAVDYEKSLVIFRPWQKPLEPGRLGIDRALNRVVLFRAIRPPGPVPATVLSADQLQAAALAFAQQQALEVFLPGGEQLTTAADGITGLGDRRFTFQRVENGIRLPLRAEVGVRVYDGKVAWYRLDVQPFDPPPAPKLDLDAARKIALADTPVEGKTLVKWLEDYREYQQVYGGWHTVWVLTGEVQAKDTRQPERVGEVRRFMIDAVDGRILEDKLLELKGEPFQRYRRHGGEHVTEPSWMRPEPSFTDSRPSCSADGKQILFLSTRSREGWPSWLRQGPGVFVVNADGTGRRCLVKEPTWDARWSADGNSLVAAQGTGVVMLDLESGKEQRFEAPEGWSCSRAVRLADGRVVALAMRHMMEYKLRFLDPANPEAVPPELKPFGERRTLLGDVMAEADGGLLFTVGTDVRMVGTRDPQRSKAPWSLYRLKPAAADTPPQTVAEYLTAGDRIGPGPAGTLLTGFYSTRWYLCDPAAGTGAPWPPEWAHLPGDGQQLRAPVLSLKDLCFSPAGDKVLFSHIYWSGKLGEPAAEVLWSADADGKNATPLTRPEAEG